MSNPYKRSMQRMEFDEEFNQNTISKMTAALKKRQSRNKKAFCGAVAAGILAIGTAVIFIHRHGAFPLETRPYETGSPAVENEPDEAHESDVSLSVQERIVKRQEYGAVGPSARSAEDIRSLAKIAGVPDDEAERVRCYEDEAYVYFFYEDGTAAGIMAEYLTGDSSEEVRPFVKLPEDEAVALAESALMKYCGSYTQETAERFTAEAWNAGADSVPHYPEWRITFTERTAGGIRRNTVSVEIDMSGRVAAVFFGVRSGVPDGELEEGAYVSEETAVSLALAQFRHEGREVDVEHFTVTAEMVEHEGSAAWVLRFEEMKNADGGYAFAWRQIYWMTLDANTGEWISTDVAR